MKRKKKRVKKGINFTAIVALLLVVVAIGSGALYVEAKAAGTDDTIMEGIYMGNIDLSGMTADEAKQTVNAFVNELKQKVVTFGAVEDRYVAITVGDLGMKWTNESDIDVAAGYGKKGD